MKLLQIAFLTLCFTSTGAARDLWSNTDNGLKARLVVLPPNDDDSVFYRVFIELKNVDDVTNQKVIPFDPKKMSFKVLKDAQEIPKIREFAYDGTTPIWKPTLLPYRGLISFQISFPGIGYTKGTKIIDLGLPYCWIIPQDGLIYRLSAIVSIKAKSGSQDWSGTLHIPPTPINAEQGAAANP